MLIFLPAVITLDVKKSLLNMKPIEPIFVATMSILEMAFLVIHAVLCIKTFSFSNATNV